MHARQALRNHPTPGGCCSEQKKLALEILWHSQQCCTHGLSSVLWPCCCLATCATLPPTMSVPKPAPVLQGGGMIWGIQWFTQSPMEVFAYGWVSNLVTRWLS